MCIVMFCLQIFNGFFYYYFLFFQVVGMVTRKDIARYRMWSHRGQIGLEEVHVLESNSIHDSF